MRRPGLIVGDTSCAESSAVGASVSFDKILAAVLDNNDEVRNIVMVLWLVEAVYSFGELVEGRGILV